MGRKKQEIIFEKRLCEECSNEFIINKKSKKRFCCSICAKRNNGKRNKGKKHFDEINKKKGLIGEKNPMFGRSYYDIWINKFGKEIADEKLNQIKENKKGKKHTKEHNKKISESLRGLKNPFFGKKHKPESLAKISENHRDCKDKNNPMFGQGDKIRREKNGSWFGGISNEPYDTLFNEELKTKVRIRDNYKCVICGKSGYVVHHIDYNKHNSIEENLVTLCKSDHMKTNSHRDSWIEFFKSIINMLYEYKIKQ